MKIVYEPRPMDGTRYTRPSMKGPPLPLDICLKPFVQLDNGNLVGPFKESDDAAAYMVEIRGVERNKPYFE